VNQEQSEQVEVDGMKKETYSTGEVMHISVIRNEEDTEGRAKVTTDDRGAVSID